MQSTRFRINAPQVINETIEGEAVMVHLTSGNYYTLDDVGAEIWSLVERQASVGEIVDALELRYEDERSALESTVQELIDELQAEDLIVAANGDGPADVAIPHEATGDRVALRKPQLQKYTDMQDLVVLDPVHEVDERGWPHAKTG